MKTEALQRSTFDNALEFRKDAAFFRGRALVHEECLQFPHVTERTHKVAASIITSLRAVATELDIPAATYEDMGFAYREIELVNKDASEISSGDNKEEVSDVAT